MLGVAARDAYSSVLPGRSGSLPRPAGKAINSPWHDCRSLPVKTISNKASEADFTLQTGKVMNVYQAGPMRGSAQVQKVKSKTIDLSKIFPFLRGA